jgi:hypothetical protein
MKIFPLTIYVLHKPFIQILPSDSKKSLWDSRTTATLEEKIQIFFLIEHGTYWSLFLIPIGIQLLFKVHTILKRPYSLPIFF